jgi:hypothetical protein
VSSGASWFTHPQTTTATMAEALVKSGDAGAYMFVDGNWTSLDGGLSAVWLFKNKDNCGARVVAKSTADQKVSCLRFFLLVSLSRFVQALASGCIIDACVYTPAHTYALLA